APSRSDRTTWAPTRFPQVSSWSTAAARKVSAAPSSTDCPSPIRARASLPHTVVLPVPLTPTTRITAGRSPCGPIRRLRSWPAPIAWMRSARSSALTASPWAPSTLTWVRCARLTRRGGRRPASGLPAAAGPDEEDTPSDGEDDDNDDGDDQVFHNGPSLADARGRSGHALSPLGLPQALAHDRGHAVTLHADPVQRVRSLHRPLLVRDDDQLRGVPQLVKDLQEALEVGVVERRLDLVQ